MSAPENPEIPYRRYVVGDVIELRLTITHEQNLERVWAIYGRGGDDVHKITFQGEIDDTTQIESEPTGDRSLPRKQSVVTLRMVVDIDHRPGFYQLLRAGCLSATSMETHVRAYDEQAPAGGLSGFYVIDEPPTAPWADFEFIDEADEDDEE